MPTPNSPPRAATKRFVYALARYVLALFFLVFYCVRFFGRENIPAHGALVVVANHQSHFDPPLLGVAVLRRQLNFLARKTLFRFKLLAWIIDLLDAIPLDQKGIGYAGIKESLKRLKRGEALLLFPEGSRTWTGEIGKFKAGFLTLARRSQAAILPTTIAGCFEAYPRTQKFPNPTGTIRVRFGKPITYDEYASLSEEELHQLVETQIKKMYHELTTQREWDE